MFRLRVLSRKIEPRSWEMQYDHLGNAISAAEADNGELLNWTYRKATKSHKSHGRNSTYYIEPMERSNNY
jgi:hypothetical protein